MRAFNSLAIGAFVLLLAANSSATEYPVGDSAGNVMYDALRIATREAHCDQCYGYMDRAIQLSDSLRFTAPGVRRTYVPGEASEREADRIQLALTGVVEDWIDCLLSNCCNEDEASLDIVVPMGKPEPRLPPPPPLALPGGQN